MVNVVLDRNRSAGRMLALFLGGLGLIACSCGGVTLRTDLSYRDASAAVVRVNSDVTECAGSRVAQGILTASHCIGPHLTAELEDGDPLPAPVLHVDPEHDLALLQDSLGSGPRLRVRSHRLSRGEAILIVGHPLGALWTVHEGHVSSARLTAGRQQIQAGTIPGFSGGPVLDADGRLSGVVLSAQIYRGRGDQQVMTDLGFVAPADWITTFLAHL